MNKKAILRKVPVLYLIKQLPAYSSDLIRLIELNSTLKLLIHSND